MDTYSYLALGDSYTIGESVSLYDSYPYQLIQQLRKSGKPFQAPEIIAKTGWTTSDLIARLSITKLNPGYDFVSLLIGVNNQYKGLSTSQYTQEFEDLIIKSISLANNYSGHVFVLAIPDWSVTPYARGRDTANISKEIAIFNNINRAVSKNHNVNYSGITNEVENVNDSGLLSGDGLHPSGRSYAKWSAELSGKILGLMS